MRDAIGAPHPYTSESADLAFDLLLERSTGRILPHGRTSRVVAGKSALDILVDGRSRRFGSDGEAIGTLTTNLETFVRLCGGRRPDRERYDLTGGGASELALSVWRQARVPISGWERYGGCDRSGRRVVRYAKRGRLLETTPLSVVARQVLLLAGVVAHV